MPDQTDEQRARQLEIDRIAAQYADDVQQRRMPNIEEYMRRYPEYAQDLMEFAVYFHTIGFEMEPPSAVPAPLSPAAQKALAQIRSGSVISSAAPIAGLVKQGATLGYSPRKLADVIGISTDLLGKLEARAIAVATIPPTLFRRLAEALKVTPEAIAAYLGAASPTQAGAFYYADQPPTQHQESFLDAVRSSALPSERKGEWADIVSAEIGGGH